MRLIALDSFDDKKEGDDFDVPDHQAARLIAKGLAKAGPIPQNKMAQRAENKSNPLPAVGVDAVLPSSPAAPASPPPTATPSGTGATPRPRGRPPSRKPPGASSR